MNTSPIYDFRNEKRYDKHPDLLDIHVPRMIEAHRIVETYMVKTPVLDSGVVLFDRFLGPDLAKAVKEQGDKSYIKDGRKPETMVNNLEGTPAFEAADPIFQIMRRFFPEHVLKEVKELFAHHTYIQHLYNVPWDGDDQKIFHSDTFFPNLKFWYFPHKIEIEEGPFWYVPGSPKLTEKLIDWHISRVADLKAGSEEHWRGPSHREGSFRISDEEISDLGLKGVPVPVEADTFVVANVFGFHKRGDTQKPSNRVSIHGSLRLRNPFKWHERDSSA